MMKLLFKRRPKKKERDIYARRRNLLEQWEEQAIERLTDIFKTEGKKLEGFEFRTSCTNCGFAYSSGTNINTIRIRDGEELILEERDSDYHESVRSEVISPDGLAWKIVSDMRYHGKFDNGRRNKFVSRLYEKTGRNLKSEVSLSRENISERTAKWLSSEWGKNFYV